MEENREYNKISFVSAIIISAAALGLFLYNSGLIASSLLVLLVGLFIIFPYRKTSVYTSRYIIIAALLLVLWLLSLLGTTLLPFIVAFLIAYVFDPLITSLQHRKFPRWLSSFLVIFLLVSSVTLISIFIIPIVFEQLDGVIKDISKYATSAKDYFQSDDFFNKIQSIGLPREYVENAIREQLLPRMEDIASIIFTGLFTILSSISAILTQIVNIIIIPILAFYLLKDFASLKDYIKSILQAKNHKLLSDVRRINSMLKKYISWQFIAAIIVAVFSSLTYSLFGVPYPIVLGILSGLVNPIPYLSIVISCVIGIVTVLLVNEGNILQHIIVIIVTINFLHFINAYLLEPNIAGPQVGLHPIILILSLFVFGGLFGFIGLLFAVPTTAMLMMFLNDWRFNLLDSIKKEFSNDG